VLLSRSWWVAGLLILASPALFDRLTGGLAYLPQAGWLSSLARLLAVAAATMAPCRVEMIRELLSDLRIRLHAPPFVEPMGCE
jgi:hypothetical protein